jgi:RimJ/RimL family protein N-acetyltransferase
VPLNPVNAFHTARVSVRAVALTDLDELMAVNGDDAVTRFLPYPSWRNREDALAWLVRMHGLVEAGTAAQLVMQHRASERVIGTVLLFNHDVASARIELGYALAREWWGQGIASEAIAATCEHAFGELGIRRIEAEVNPDNAGSNALLRRLGFMHEGVLRKRWVGRQGAYDSNIYGCLAEEWRGRQP